MPAPKLKSIYGLLGKPIASSTPIKELFDTCKEHSPYVEKKTIQEQYAGNRKMFNGDQNPTSTHVKNVVQYNLEIVTSDSDSDSDIMPSNKNKLISPKADRPVAPSSKSVCATNVGKKKQLEKVLVKSHKVVPSTVATPVTGMPPALARQSLCRTLSRISASAAEKFMVEIPNDAAGSFSESLQLIKRRIDFETIDEPKKQRLDVGETDISQNKKTRFEGIEKNKYRDGKKGGRKRELTQSTLKSPQDTNTATVPRKISALIPSFSPEKELEPKITKAALEGVRKSMRTRIAPIPFWLGNTSEEQADIFSQNKTKRKKYSDISSTSIPTNKNNLLKKNSSLQVNKIKEQEKTGPGKSMRRKEDSSNVLRKSDIANQMKVCCSNFDQSVFVPSDGEEDGDEIGVQYATSLQTFDMQSEFIRLLPGAKTINLISPNYNQLYTVLENTICLYAEDVPKQFDLHSQFYVCKGVPHTLCNNSSESSLLLQVIIQK